MTKRTTWILAAVAGALLAFILLYERELPSTDELAERADRLLRTFDRDGVETVRIERGSGQGAGVTLERVPDAEGGAADPLAAVEDDRWRVTSPVADRADADAVEALLGALEWASPSRTLERVTDGDRTRFGLDEPRATVTLEGPRGTTELVLGNEPPRGGGVYVMVDRGRDASREGPVVHVVGEDLFEAVDHGPDHFREKDPFPGLAIADADALELHSPLGEAQITRGDGEDAVGNARWSLGGALEGIASDRQVGALLRQLADLRIRRFIDEAPEGLGAYGLESPRCSVTVSGPGDDGRFEATVKLGDPCPERPGEVHARFDEDGPVVCVDGDLLETLSRPPETFRERRLLPFGNDEVAAVHLVADGRRLTLARREAGGGDGGNGTGFRWRLAPAGAGDDAEALGSGDADEGAVAGFLDELRGVEADAFLPVDARKLRASGLTDPSTSIRIEGLDGGSWELAFGGPSPDGRFVRREDEPAILMVSGDALAGLLTTAPTRFRDRQPVTFDPGDVRELTVVRADGPTERVVRVDAAEGDDAPTRWRLVAPVEVPADRIAVDDALRVLADLEVRRWVAETPEPAHGLATPVVRVTLRLREGSGDGAAGSGPGDDESGGTERTLVVSLGARTTGADGAPEAGGGEAGETADGDPPPEPAAPARYGRLGEDGAVFTVAPRVLDGLEPLLADRSVLSTDRSDVAAISLERGGRSVVVDLDRSPAVLDALGTLRARRVLGYLLGADAAARPQGLRVAVRRGEGAPAPDRYEMVLRPSPAVAPEGDDDAAPPPVTARRLDLPVLYEVARPDVAALFDAAP